MTSPPEQLVQIQNILKEIFLMMPSTNFAQRNNMVPELKIELSLNDISSATASQYTRWVIQGPRALLFNSKKFSKSVKTGKKG